MEEQFDLKLAFLNADRFSLATYSIFHKLTGNIELAVDYRKFFEAPLVQAKDSSISIIFWSNKSSISDGDYLVPYVVNASFTIELYLKCLLFVDTRKTYEKIHAHNILYSNLSQNVKALVKARYNALIQANIPMQSPKIIELIKKMDSNFNWEIEYILRRNALAFEKWRYQYEKNATCFYAFGELRISLRDAIIKLNPELERERIHKK